MTYAVSPAVQAAVFQALSEDVDLSALVGDAIYDEVPSGALPKVYVVLGPETVLDRSDATGSGTLHQLTISVISKAAGFAFAKTVAGAVSDAMTRPMTLDRGQLVYLNFDRADARRSGRSAALRQIDLRFRARVDDV